MRRGMKDLSRGFKSHPDGFIKLLRMDFDAFKSGGWEHVRPLELENKAGYTIQAVFGWVDGFQAWRYRTKCPDGRSLGAFATAANAALWIDRDMRSSYAG